MFTKLSLANKCCWLVAVATIIALASCGDNYVAKPRGYYKIDFPNKEYQDFNIPGYPYTFQYPTYAKIIKDSTFLNHKAENDWWINVDFPQFNGKIYVSYNIVGGKALFKVSRNGVYVDSVGTNSFEKLIKDSYTLTYKHTVKAASIDDSVFRTANNISGVMFKLGGDAATAQQFFLTDSVKHFLRGALYFDATPNEDSLSVVNDFLMQDVKHLINSFKWK